MVGKLGGQLSGWVGMRLGGQVGGQLPGWLAWCLVDGWVATFTVAGLGAGCLAGWVGTWRIGVGGGWLAGLGGWLPGWLGD